jgi:translation initiation factor eIF-2B subunit alpha
MCSKTFSELKTELIEQAKNYAAEALGYRDKIADLSLGFIKDDSVVGVFRDDSMVLG